MRDSKLVIAYIGNGKSTNRYHAPFVLNRKDRFLIKKIYNPRIHHDVWAEIDGVEYTTNLDDVLQDPEIDLVVVSTAHTLHYTYSKLVLNAGKHLLCEKPFMENSAQAREIFALAKIRGLFCSAYQNRRFDSDFLTVKKVIESGKLGELIEVEQNFDYYRPETPEKATSFSAAGSFLYGHACHSLDQMISLFGRPDSVHYDVRQLLGPGRMNDYFDIDLYYGLIKVSVRSGFFRLKPRSKFVVCGKKGVFEKVTEDRQEEHLKMFYMPDHEDFGLDKPEHFGTLSYLSDDKVYHEEKVVSERGDYGLFYDSLYETIVCGKEQLVKPEETILQMEMLEEGIKGLY